MEVVELEAIAQISQHKGDSEDDICCLLQFFQKFRSFRHFEKQGARRDKLAQSQIDSLFQQRSKFGLGQRRERGEAEDGETECTLQIMVEHLSDQSPARKPGLQTNVQYAERLLLAAATVIIDELRTLRSSEKIQKLLHPLSVLR